MQLQTLFEKTRAVRYVEEPAASPCFRSVSRIWQFPSGDVLLELSERRDCLLPNIDRVDVPASECHRVAESVVIETDTTVEVTAKDNIQKVTEFDRKIVL